ncbi:hypothetical protein GCM10025864_33020 [Luteimicrobium album]|uniref:Epoxide hydrolase N-terminal domain-containing protein n=1 Tax=Luteimicrobium album TaxID=1054550 RepID=A0ABQ6I464_9MICO|nr:epoxide hydrolase family protein [Luteimicrobium album]GMA25543.1 hypothetical protein GCM10025864_33020 [Luteimicrobium album]
MTFQEQPLQSRPNPVAPPSVFEPFDVVVDPERTVDLRDRLARTAWPVEPASVGADQGMPVATVRALADRWRELDLDAVAARVNAFPQLTTVIDGQRVHFWHVRAARPSGSPATALLLLHGWPSTLLEYARVVGPLTDPVAHGAPDAPAFDVVVPSLPGFGFSGPTTQTGWDSARSAGRSPRSWRAWATSGGASWGTTSARWSAASSGSSRRTGSSACTCSRSSRSRRAMRTRTRG